ncbi:hypothetical protein ACFY2H_37720 [Streptomyces griseofuscus]|uniref:hypothetical protein n=1 Tax=Streptomyces griseofuscus TaxID=146922 RepID=UPI0036AD79F8
MVVQRVQGLGLVHMQYGADGPRAEQRRFRRVYAACVWLALPGGYAHGIADLARRFAHDLTVVYSVTPDIGH